MNCLKRMIDIYSPLPFPGETENEENLIQSHEEKCANQMRLQEEDRDLPSSPMTDLDDKTIEFIRPWFRRWKTQSMYQILLLCRSTQERNTVYFCQQVHIYNQNDRSIMESMNVEISLNDIDASSDGRALIPKNKISVHKTPFRLSDLTFIDSSYLCGLVRAESDTKLMKEEEEEEEEEDWDAPLKCFFKKEEPPQNIISNHGNNFLEDKECQTDLFEINGTKTFRDENHNFSSSHCETEKLATNPDKIKEDAADINSNEIALSSEEILDKMIPPKVIRKPPKYIGIQPRRNSEEKDKTDTINPYSRDSLRIKNINQKEQDIFSTPIRELEEKFKTKQKSSDNNDDDPPYNFRAMLRKTNYTESSYQKQTEPVIKTYDFTLKKLKKVDEPKIERIITSTVLAPGLMIEGEITHL